MHAVFRSRLFPKHLASLSRKFYLGEGISLRYYSQSGVSSALQNVDLYGLLKTTPNASQQQIKSAYYKQSLLWHPDRNKESENAHKKFTELTEAYKILGDTHARREYDRRMKVESLYQAHRSPFHKETIHNSHTHARVSGSSRQYDTWTRTHYKEALAKRDARERRNTLRQNLSQEESQHQSLRVSIILFVVCFAFGFVMIKNKMIDRKK